MPEVSISKVSAAMFSDLQRWIVPKIIFNPKDIPSDWQIVKVGDISSLVEQKEKVISQKEYKMAGVRWYGEGVFHRETVLGKNLSATYVTPCIKDALIYNRLFAWKESFAVVTDEYTDCYVSNEFPQFIVDKTKVIPFYLYLFFNTKAAIRAVKKDSVGSSAVSRNRFKEEYFLVYEIPLPPLNVQQQIVDYWNKGQNEAANLSSKIKHIQAATENYFTETLGVSTHSNTTTQRYFASMWDELARWDIVFAKSDKSRFASGRYCVKRLRDLILPLKKTNSRMVPAAMPEKEFNYIGMENVESETGRIVNFSPVKGKQIKSSSVIFDDEHILYGKLRPYLRKVVTPNMYGINSGVASSEFIAIKAKEGVHRLYLAEYLRSKLIAEQSKLAIGARMPRVSTSMFLDFMVVLPSLNIQNQIVNKIKDSRKEIESAFHEIETIRGLYRRRVELVILGIKTIKEVMK